MCQNAMFSVREWVLLLIYAWNAMKTAILFHFILWHTPDWLLISCSNAVNSFAFFSTCFQFCFYAALEPDSDKISTLSYSLKIRPTKIYKMIKQKNEAKFDWFIKLWMDMAISCIWDCSFIFGTRIEDQLKDVFERNSLWQQRNQQIFHNIEVNIDQELQFVLYWYSSKTWKSLSI